jgi:hypothetical protein
LRFELIRLGNEALFKYVFETSWFPISAHQSLVVLKVPHPDIGDIACIIGHISWGSIAVALSTELTTIVDSSRRHMLRDAVREATLTLRNVLNVLDTTVVSRMRRSFGFVSFPI